jgi:type I restriction enzyme S subunit
VEKLKSAGLDLLMNRRFSSSNSGKWAHCKLSEIASLQSGMAFKSPRFLKQGSNQVIRMSNMSPGKLRLENNAVFISQTDADESEKVKLTPDDIIISMTGTKGKRDYLYSVKISENEMKGRELFLNQRICRIRPRDCLPDYLSLALRSNSVLDPVFESSTGTANQANASMKSISGMIIPLPELSEQARLVDLFTALLRKFETLAENIRESEALKVELAESVVHHISERRNQGCRPILFGPKACFRTS